MHRRIIAAVALVVTAVCACDDSALEWQCDSRVAVRTAHEFVADGAPIPSCESACAPSMPEESLVACTLLGEELDDGGLVDVERSGARVDAGRTDAGDDAPAHRRFRYYCELEGARGSCHRR